MPLHCPSEGEQPAADRPGDARAFQGEWHDGIAGVTAFTTPEVALMVLSCGNSVQPTAEADQRAGGPVDVPDAVQQPAPAAQRPGVGQVRDRLLHQRAQARLQAVEGPLGVAEAVLGAAVPERRVPVLARLGQPPEPRSSRLATSTSSSIGSSPASSISSCSWQLPGQPPPPTAGRPSWSTAPGPGRCGRAAWRRTAPSG
jgi:hypothetical protein